MSQLVRDTASVMQEFTQSGGVRPFGLSLLVAGFDDSGPQLFQVDPSGAYFGWKATAIGKNHVRALECSAWSGLAAAGGWMARRRREAVPYLTPSPATHRLSPQHTHTPHTTRHNR